MADLKQIKVGSTTYNIEPYTDYLPLTGGTLENTANNVPLILKGATTKSTGAYLGFQWGSHTGPNYFIGVEGGIPYFLSGASTYRLLHNGNLKIDGARASSDGTVINRYGVCSTAAGLAAKTVTLTSGIFTLEAGVRVSVKFERLNEASNPTLNVNSTGAKNIFHKGSKITTAINRQLLYGIVDFIYDGTQWHLVGNYVDTNSQSAYGNITTAGKITSTAVTSATGFLVYDSSNKIQRATSAKARTIIGAAASDHTHSSFDSLTLSGGTPLLLTGYGTGTYNKGAFVCNTTDKFGVECPRETDSASGTIVPFRIGVRGGQLGTLEAGDITSNGNKVLTEGTFSYSSKTLFIKV